jgi:S-adenosylmethionine:tRNA ribosyltransferase-isomerase
MEGSEEIAFRLEDYDYDLPADLVAQIPTPRRGASRLLVVDRFRKELEHRQFDGICDYLMPGDLVVLNDTRVVPARLQGTKETGGRVELLVLDPYKDPECGEREGYTCLLKASKKPLPESLIVFQDGAQAQVLTPVVEGKAQVRFHTSTPLLDLLERVGNVPLPPYIQRNIDAPSPIDDAKVYQTVYAQNPGAVAAPTAGLHFSKSLLDDLEAKGVQFASITLHVGYGTFSPIRVEDVREHRMHSEYFEIPRDSAERIEDARREGRRIVAVGTTVVRTLEWVALNCSRIIASSGLCDHYIYPGYRFQVVNAMITNFHLPKSTLLLLVSAFAGRETILNAYRSAVEERYRFFSYGDSMFII